MQLTYDQKATDLVAGMTVGEVETVPTHNLSTKTINVSVDTVTNSLLYRIAVKYLSKVPATYGQTLTTNCDYTADGSATKAEILAGLLAAVNASVAPVTAKVFDSALGPIQIAAKTRDQDFTLTVSTELSQAAVSGEIPFGVVVCMQDTTPDKCRLPVVAGDIGNKTLGITLRSFAMENNTAGTAVYPLDSSVQVAREGLVAAAVEEAVSAGDDVWVRYAAKGANTQLGALRKSPDGVAKVIDVTPTAVNAGDYVIGIGQYSYHYTADGTATAAEIIAGLLAKVNLQTALHGVTASDGTTTLTLTGTAGVDFDYSVGSNLSAAVTTAGTQTAAKLSRAKFHKGAGAAALAVVSLELL